MKDYQEAYIHSGTGVMASFNFKAILDKFFADLINNFKPMLVIPKRSIIYNTPVTVPKGKYYINDGSYITNLLFYLKSQNPGSPEVEKYEKISRAFEQITGCSFSISLSKFNENELLLSFNIPNNIESWVSGDSSGLGLSDSLILITFIIASDATLMLIEEPENHLHPEMQRKFLNFIRTFDTKQFILSTHSNMFLDPYIINKIFYVEFDDGVKLTDETSKSEMLYNLGYSVSDNLVSDMILL